MLHIFSNFFGEWQLEARSQARLGPACTLALIVRCGLAATPLHTSHEHKFWSLDVNGVFHAHVASSTCALYSSIDDQVLINRIRQVLRTTTSRRKP